MRRRERDMIPRMPVLGRDDEVPLRCPFGVFEEFVDMGEGVAAFGDGEASGGREKVVLYVDDDEGCWGHGGGIQA